ncbi:hypothetical protein JQT66_07090 [Sulfitobacter mediterraneus]|jgi:Family of unknown function (DUF6778)|uniref:DUF6778 family protein n=3 Tax=Roseobacteraceae TaxID=2854170 RepID=UPI00193A92B5|nr:DUF6778 family protein [Sulfitobacter mediterraneus]MBM1313809.1 hypothetical protein [Sulfitobacter mediterraneus]MBM1416862.1 hypothetical protein [Sulfitobacter mediterraneus]MBM1428514.1 hypothetical protein [Sulfitobacter mediterraneus]MBM1447942.1 hypothetical protein [Sulfitobacter mediterraneus]MBM1459176.1 hypothetical protein [Sulfitobacter mediterraneus]
MMNRRSFLAMAALTAVAACAEPLLDEQTAGSLKVVDVSVDVSQIEGVKGRQITVAPEKIQADVRNHLLAYLKDGSVGSRPVKAEVSITQFHLVSPGQALLVGGTSTISGVLTVKDARNGTVVLEPTKVYGTAKGGWALGGLVGAAVKADQTPEQDYKATIVGFSQDVRKRLLGAEK